MKEADWGRKWRKEGKKEKKVQIINIMNTIHSIKKWILKTWWKNLNIMIIINIIKKNYITNGMIIRNIINIMNIMNIMNITKILNNKKNYE